METMFPELSGVTGVQEFLTAAQNLCRSRLNAGRVIIYRFDPAGKDLIPISDSLGGQTVRRVPLTLETLAGFAGLRHQPLRILDVYDTNALAAVHPDLRFDIERDRHDRQVTRGAMVFPAVHGAQVLGVLELCNCTNRENRLAFSTEDFNGGLELARHLGELLWRETEEQRADPFEPLVAQGLVDRQRLVQFRQLARKGRLSVGKLLISEAEVPPDAVGACLEEFYNAPYVAYDPKRVLDQALLDRLNRDFLRRQRWVPLAQAGTRAAILIDDPSDEERILEAGSILGVAHCEVRVGLVEDILAFLEPRVNVTIEVEKSPENLETLVGELQAEGVGSVGGGRRDDTTELDDSAAPAVVRLVSRVIAEAISRNASDIHIEPAREPDAATVRIRVDGECHVLLSIPAVRIRQVVARVKVMSNLDISEKRMPQDGKMAVEMSGTVYELRVATVPTVHGECVVMRILSHGGVLTLDQLCLSDGNRRTLEKLLERPHGIFLVVGPTGSGKTTTLHAVLGHINTPDVKIWTAEDPVEITQKGLQQVQVNPKIEFTFARAMRAFLRADPDVILIGEMRDYETAHIGMEASLTGHLVFSTLHTNSAPESITRLLDMGLDPLNFGDALIGILAQRLVRRLCSKCKQPEKATEEELTILREAYGLKYAAELGIDGKEVTLFRKVGCDACLKTGYKGRVGIHELLAASKPLKSLITHKRPAEEIGALAMNEGMRVLRQDGVAKVIQGITDFAEVRRATLEE